MLIGIWDLNLKLTGIWDWGPPIYIWGKMGENRIIQSNGKIASSCHSAIMQSVIFLQNLVCVNWHPDEKLDHSPRFFCRFVLTSVKNEVTDGCQNWLVFRLTVF